MPALAGLAPWDGVPRPAPGRAGSRCAGACCRAAPPPCPALVQDVTAPCFFLINAEGTTLLTRPLTSCQLCKIESTWEVSVDVNINKFCLP